MERVEVSHLQREDSLQNIAEEYLCVKKSALRSTIIWGGIRAGATSAAIITVATHGSSETPIFGQSLDFIYNVSDTVELSLSPDKLTSIFKKTLPVLAILNARDVMKLYFQRKSIGKLEDRIQNVQNANK